MKTIARLALTSGLIAPFLLTGTAGNDNFYQNQLPPGVTMGMFPDELKKTRPNTRKNTLGLTGAACSDCSEMFEIRRERDTAAVTWYRFKAGRLGAVTDSLDTTGIPCERIHSAANALLKELTADFLLRGNEQIVRSPDTAAAVLTAQLWEDRRKGFNVYFVATNQEMTVVSFDPKVFGKADFFIGPERLERVRANNECIRRQLGASAPPPIPILDLLGEAKLQIADPPSTAITPAPVTPKPPVTMPAAPTAVAPEAQPASRSS